MPDFWSFLIMLVPTGLTLLTFTTAANSAIQLGTTADMRGRVMGLYMLVFLGGAPLGAPLAGWVAEVFGPRMSLIAGGRDLRRGHGRDRGRARSHRAACACASTCGPRELARLVA